ncbi:MAG TPA: aminoglycoside phosphotransferase family protein [Pyrinomonadaceae bacterium]|nr:aminoglycoside phosphotransferase family protein [Pyrinomonadaceae bacterium]
MRPPARNRSLPHAARRPARRPARLLRRGREPEAGRFWLFLENVRGSKMRHVGEFEVWREVARWLARAHAAFAPEADTLARTHGAHLIRYDASFFRLWMRRAREFTRAAVRQGLTGADDALRRVERLSEVYGRVLSYVAALPRTLVHGDFFASNILARQEGARLRVCPVDWEMTGLGPGLLDLAALTSGSWGEEQRAALALDYRDALRSHGAQTYGVAALAPEEFLRALDCCHVCLAVQWLGWATDWQPPSDEAQDWLSVALRLVERLSL